MPTGTITGTFGWDNSPLIAGMRQAEKQGATTAAKIVSELKTVDTATKKSTVNWAALAAERRRAMQFVNGPAGRGYKTGADFLPAPAGKYAPPPFYSGSAGAGAGMAVEKEMSALRIMGRGRTFGGLGAGLFGGAGRFSGIAGALGGGAGALGLGLGAAGGIGALIAGIVRIRQVEDATKSSAKELRRELQGISREIRFESASEGPGALGSRLEEERKNLRHLKDELGQFDYSRHPFLNITRGIGSMIGLAKSPGDRARDTTKQIGEAAANRATTHGTLLQSLRDELSLTAEQIAGSEGLAKWEEKRLKYQKELQDLRKAGVKDSELSAFTKRYTLEKRLFQQEQQTELLQSKLKQRASYGANVGSGKTGAQANIKDLRRRRDEIRRQQRLPHTIEQGRQLEEDKLDVSNQIDAATLTASRMNPGDLREAQRRSQRDQFDIRQLNRNKGLINVRRDIGGNVIGGTDPFTGLSRTVGTESGGSHLARGEMAKPGRMTPFGGTDDFNQFFSKGRNNTSLTQKEAETEAASSKPLTKEDLKDVMKEYWEGDGGGGGSTGGGGG